MHCYISATCKKDQKQGCSTLEWYRANDHGWLWHWIESNWNPWHGSVHGWSVWNDRRVGFSQHSPPLSQIHQFSLSTHVPVQAQVQTYIYCMQDARFQKDWAKHLIVSSMGFFSAQPLHFLLIECGDICYIVMGDQDKDSQIWIREGKWHRRLGEIK